MINVEKRPFKIGQYISDGFDIFKKEWGVFIGFLLVALIVVGIASLVLNLIPTVGGILTSIFSSLVFAGFYLMAHSIANGKQADFGEAFGGFQKFVPIAIYSIIVSGIVTIVSYLFMGDTIKTFQLNDPEDIEILMESADELLKSLPIILILALLVYLISFYAICNILFLNHDALTALKSSAELAFKNPIQIVLFLIIWSIILMFSAILLFVGLLVTFPAMYCSTYAAWRDQTGYGQEEQLNVADNLV